MALEVPPIHTHDDPARQIRPPRPPWPGAAIDPQTLRDKGWRPTPIGEFVLKVYQRCNLACAYCYVYEMADQSWLERPLLMPEEVWTAAAERIARHVRTHRLDEISVVLHGGEPLMAKEHRLIPIVQAVRDAVPRSTTVSFSVQTNGTLLTKRLLELFLEHEIHVGVSLDGGAEENDAHRRHRDGRGSFAGVERGLRLLANEYRPIYSGLLCTIDPATNPVAIYEALLKFSPPTMDVLLPHANWTMPGAGGDTRFADWLIPLFDRWSDAPRLETRIRLFESIISLIMGGQSRVESVGLTPAAVAVVETDGAIEQTDALKSAYPGAAETGLSVLAHDFDQLLEHPGIVARQIGLAALSDACLECSLVKVCGGGHYAHRYHMETGFVSPSVYCADLKKLIRHIRTQFELRGDSLM